MRSRRPSASSSWRPARASSTGSAVSEYRMVSPMPSASRVAIPAVPFSRPGRRRSGLGHPEVQGVVEGLRRQAVGVDHERDRGRLHRDLHVVEVDLLEVGQLVAGRLDQGLGGGAAVLLVELGVRATRALTPIRIGTPRSLGLAGDQLDLGLLAEVAGVEPQALHPGLQRGERHLVVEVDVGDDRHRRARDDLGQALGRGLLVAGAAHDVRAGRRQGVDLGQGALDVGGLGGGHRLDRDRRTTADGHPAHGDLAGGPARRDQLRGNFHLVSILPRRAGLSGS